MTKMKPLERKTFDELSIAQKQKLRSYFEKRLCYPLGQQEYLNWFFSEVVIPTEFPNAPFFLTYLVDIIRHNKLTLSFDLCFFSPEEVKRFLDYTYGKRRASSPIVQDKVDDISILVTSEMPEERDILVIWSAKEKGETILTDGFSEDDVRKYIARQFRPLLENSIEWLENEWSQVKARPDTVIDDYVREQEFYVSGEGVVYIGASRYVQCDDDGNDLNLYEVDVKNRCDFV